MLKKWLREPLLHFLLIGAALFLLYGLENDRVDTDRNRIVVSEADIDRLITLWEKQRQRLPAPFELEGLIERQIREQVLYREALAMGLDQDDVIVRRRLAQKVEFIFSDIASLVEPSDEQLRQFLETHAELFEISGRISFRQAYLNIDKRGVNAEQDAIGLLEELTKAGPAADVSNAGDRFMFGEQYADQTPQEVSRVFGQEFSESLFKLPVGDWVGPVQSGYGLHVVQIDNRVEPRQPGLDVVREKVLNEWRAQQRREADEMFYQNLRKRYEIVIENTGAYTQVAGNNALGGN